MSYKIYVGSRTQPDYYFEQETSFDVKSVQKVSLVGKELTIDTFEPVVEDDITNLVDVYHFRSSDGHEIMDSVGQIFCIDVGEGVGESDLINLEYGTPVWYYWKDTLVGLFYSSKVEREAKNRYLLRCVSVIGLLDKMDHYGGLFTATTFGVVLDHVLAEDPHGTGNPVITYEIQDEVAELPVSGWMSKDTKRNNLYKLMFANGVNIVKSADGYPRFTFIHPAPPNPEAIPQGNVYDSGSMDYEKPYSKVTVAEHQYAPLTSEDPVTLFDNTTGEAVVNEEIFFTNAPIIVASLTATSGLAFSNATVNSVVLNGNGKLTGIPYTHTTRSLVSELSGGDREKTARVENCTMVNAINSANLLARLKAFYQPTDDSTTPPTPLLIKTIKNGIMYTDQRCGKPYKFVSPFDEDIVAYLTTMNINAGEVERVAEEGEGSTTVGNSVPMVIGAGRADCEWRANYTPAGQLGLYEHVDRLQIDLEEPVTEGDWVVPDGVTQFKVVIIGGGTGGGSGWPGKNGRDAHCYTEVAETDDLSGIWYGAEGGDGGDGGAGGSPGRVKIVTVENAVPGTTYHWTLGSGGEGGESTGFIPDTFAELKSMLQSTEPDITYTDSQITDMVADEQTLSGWSGSPNAGSAGTASTFGSWSSADQDAYVPTGGVYEPIYDDYYALTGNGGIKGGKGGARQVKSGDTFNWVTDGEDVVGDNGETYRGGSTGVMLTTVTGLPEASIKAYGGNGAGAAVGIDRANNPHINGNSDQTTWWDVTEDS